MLSLIRIAAHGSGVLCVNHGLRFFTSPRQCLTALQVPGWRDRDARTGAVGQREHHAAFDFVAGKLSLP